MTVNRFSAQDLVAGNGSLQQDSLLNSPVADDSLRGFPIADIALSPEPVDTLQVTAAEMFGQNSELTLPSVTSIISHPYHAFLSDSLLFKIFTIACFAVYCLVLYYYRQQTSSAVSIFRSKLYVEKLLDERNYTFESMLNTALLLGLTAVSLAAIKTADIYAGEAIASVIPKWGLELLVPVVWAVMGLMVLYQMLVLNIAGSLTFSMRFVSRLRYLRKILFSVSVLLLTPTVLMYCLADQRGSEVLLVLLLIQLVGFVFFHFRRTYVLFIEEKISKLYWFLYLCAVEIFPVTLLALLVLKNVL